jgi:hypothetical protein
MLRINDSQVPANISVYLRAAFYAASGKVSLVAAEGCLW